MQALKQAAQTAKATPAVNNNAGSTNMAGKSPAIVALLGGKSLVDCIMDGTLENCVPKLLGWYNPATQANNRSLGLELTIGGVKYHTRFSQSVLGTFKEGKINADLEGMVSRNELRFISGISNTGGRPYFTVGKVGGSGYDTIEDVVDTTVSAVAPDAVPAGQPATA